MKLDILKYEIFRYLDGHITVTVTVTVTVIVIDSYIVSEKVTLVS